MFFQLVPPVYAAASPWLGPCVGSSSVNGVDASNVATITGVACLLRNLIEPVPVLIALSAVIMIIYSGFRIVTAGADAKALASAWQTFTWAVIGLILLAVIWFALVLVEQFTGASVTKLDI